MGERRGVYRVLVGNLRERSHLDNQGLDGRIILRWIFRQWDVGHGLDRSGSGQGQAEGTCKYAVMSLYIKCGEFPN